MWTSLLVGTRQDLRDPPPAVGLILDPYTRLYVFDGKGGKDWDAAEAVAYRFVRGDELEHAYAVRGYLVELVAEVQSRFTRMATLAGLGGVAVSLELPVRVELTPARCFAGVPVSGVVNSTPATFWAEKTSLMSSSWTAPTGKPAREHAVGMGRSPVR